MQQNQQQKYTTIYGKIVTVLMSAIWQISKLIQQINIIQPNWYVIQMQRQAT